jgi:hypothetical protein
MCSPQEISLSTEHFVSTYGTVPYSAWVDRRLAYRTKPFIPLHIMYFSTPENLKPEALIGSIKDLKWEYLFLSMGKVKGNEP